MAHPSLPRARSEAITLDEIAAAIGGTVHGDGTWRVRALVYPTEARAADEMVFVMDPRLAAALPQSPVRAAVVGEGIAVPEGALTGWVEVPRPRYALAALLDLFAAPVHAPPGVHPSAAVDPTARLGEDVSVGALAYVGPGAVIGRGTVLAPQSHVGTGAVLGEDCLIQPGARIGDRVVLGHRVLVHPNAVIGADGFSFVTPGTATFEAAKRSGDHVDMRNEGLRRINSIGTVVVGDDVEVGACTCIDRANVGATVIGPGTKIDNLVQIGHNNRVGAGVLMSGQVGVSGSCRIGDGAVLAGRAGIADHVEIGAGAVVAAGSGVAGNVAEGQVVIGFPALPKTEAAKREMNIRRLDRLLREVRELAERVGTLERG